MERFLETRKPSAKNVRAPSSDPSPTLSLRSFRNRGRGIHGRKFWQSSCNNPASQNGEILTHKKAAARHC